MADNKPTASGSDQSIEDLLTGSAPAAAAPGDQSIEDLLGSEGLAAKPGSQIPVNTAVAAGHPQSGVERYIAGIGSAAIKGLDYGLGIPGDLEALGVEYLGNPLNRMLGWKEEPDPWKIGPEGTLFPTSSDLLDITGHAGLTDRADLVPGQPPGNSRAVAAAERYGSAAVSGAFSALPFGGVTSPVKVPLAGAAGGVAGQAASEYAPGNKLLPLAAGLAAGTGVQAGASAFAGNVINKVAKTLGSASTIQEAGEALQSGARDWLDGHQGLQDTAWTPTNAAIPPGTPVPLTNYLSTLRSITGKGGALLEGQLAKLKGKLPQDLLVDLQNKITAFAGLGSPTIPSWKDVSDLSTTLGDALHNPAILKDTSKQELDKIYAALQSDRRAAAQGLDAANPGLNATAKFDASTRASKALFDFAGGPLGDLVEGASPNVKDKSPEKVAKALLTSGRSGGTALAALRAGGLDKPVDELASALLRTTPEAWAKLSPEAKQALVPYDRMRALLEKAVPEAINKAKNSGPSATQSLLHFFSGEGAATVAQHLLGSGVLPSSDLASALSGLGAVAAPYAWRGIKAVARNPRLLEGPVAGAIGGGNALFPNPHSKAP